MFAVPTITGFEIETLGTACFSNVRTLDGRGCISNGPPIKRYGNQEPFHAIVDFLHVFETSLCGEEMRPGRSSWIRYLVICMPDLARQALGAHYHKLLVEIASHQL